LRDLAIALATGCTYDVVLGEAVRIAADAVKRGMIWRDMRRTIAALGLSSTLRRKYDIDEDTGILGLKRERGKEEHVVYLWAGRIIEPRLDRRGLWMDPSAFLANEGWVVTTLLVVHR
jgi:hypothetical protein